MTQTATPQRLDIAPATLLSVTSHAVPGQLYITELFFEVPLDYTQPDGPRIQLFGRLAAKRESPIWPQTPTPAPETQPSTGTSAVIEAQDPQPKPLMVYLEGGPGFGNREPQDHALTRHAIARGYHVLYLDHRGVGNSTPVSAEMLERTVGSDPGKQAGYLRLMRQDNTVRDCEAVRKKITEGWPEQKTQWSLWGQSYGGFVSLSYLSMHPEGVREVFLTGGLAPVLRDADEVYRATYRKVVERNEAYYEKFPEDVQAVHYIIDAINAEGGSIPLPAGGTLTVPRLLTLGISFGKYGGFDSVHATLLHLKTSLIQSGFFTRACLSSLESANPLDTNIIYAILHEAIYCNGPGYASNWAAHRVGRAVPELPWLDSAEGLDKEKPVFFSGEMIYPEHFSTYAELKPLKEAAERLAQTDDWEPLYDAAQLARNEVPVYAAVFIEDMYVDYVLSKETARLVKGTKTFETNMMHHSALSSKTDELMQNLFALRDDVLD